LICDLRFILGSLILLLGCRLILLRRLLCSLRLIDKSLNSIQLKNKCSHLCLKIVQSRLYSQVSPCHESKVGAGLRHKLIDVTLQCVEVVADHTEATLTGLCGTIIKQDTKASLIYCSLILISLIRLFCLVLRNIVDRDDVILSGSVIAILDVLARIQILIHRFTKKNRASGGEILRQTLGDKPFGCLSVNANVITLKLNINYSCIISYRSGLICSFGLILCVLICILIFCFSYAG
jgi:hypothetical protein